MAAGSASIAACESPSRAPCLLARALPPGANAVFACASSSLSAELHSFATLPSGPTAAVFRLSWRCDEQRPLASFAHLSEPIALRPLAFPRHTNSKGLRRFVNQIRCLMSHSTMCSTNAGWNGVPPTTAQPQGLAWRCRRRVRHAVGCEYADVPGAASKPKIPSAPHACRGEIRVATGFAVDA